MNHNQHIDRKAMEAAGWVLGTNGRWTPPAVPRWLPVPKGSVMTHDQLKAALQQAGITQQRFADLMGVELTAVKRWCSSSAKQRRPVPNAAAMVLLALQQGLITEAWIIDLPRVEGVDRAPQ